MQPSGPAQFSMLPPVIFNLLIANALVFLAVTVDPGLGRALFAHLALWPPAPDAAAALRGAQPFRIWQLVTYAFLHGGLAHLFFNLFAMWMFGMQIENAWGSKRFAVYYAVCVVGAGLVQLAVVSISGSTYPTVGASGGVFGILLAFGMMFPNQRILLLFPPIPIRAKWFVIGYGAIELFAGITGTQSGVAHFAHLGGMAFGLLLIQYWRGRLPVKPRRRMLW